MKVFEILSLAPDLLKKLHENGIRHDDFKWLALYREYEEMKSKKEKTIYIVAVLSSKYNICERKVYKIIKRLQRDCQ